MSSQFLSTLTTVEATPGFKYFTNNGWSAGVLKYWNGTTWTTGTLKRWDGNSWVTL